MMIEIAVPDGEELLGLISWRLEPNGNFKMQAHPAEGNGEVMPHSPKLVHALRWFADAIELQMLPTTEA